MKKTKNILLILYILFFYNYSITAFIDSNEIKELIKEELENQRKWLQSEKLSSEEITKEIKEREEEARDYYKNLNQKRLREIKLKELLNQEDIWKSESFGTINKVSKYVFIGGLLAGTAGIIGLYLHNKEINKLKLIAFFVGTTLSGFGIAYYLNNQDIKNFNIFLNNEKKDYEENQGKFIEKIIIGINAKPYRDKYKNRFIEKCKAKIKSPS